MGRRNEAGRFPTVVRLDVAVERKVSLLKWEPWLGSGLMPGSAPSTTARAPEIWSQRTGMPSHGSAEPQRPKPISR